MGEPARKIHEEIQPDIRPHFDVVNGGGERTPDRANLRSLESNPEKTNSNDSIREQESQGNASNIIQGPWANNVTGKTGPTNATGFLGIIKKRGPLTAIILTLVGGGIGISGLLAPASLLLQFKEVVVSRFNLQLPSMDARTVQLYNAKTTKGMLCGSVLSIGCKYSTLSEKQIANFEKAGIAVNSESKTIFGRTKPTSFEFNGETIEAADFKNKMISDSEFGAAVQKAYNPKFSGFSDRVFSWVEAKLGISKANANLSGDTDAEKLASIQEDTSTPAQVEEPQTIKPDDPDYVNPETGEPYTQAQADAANAAAAQADDIMDGAADIVQSGQTASADAAEEIAAAEAQAVAKVGVGSTVLNSLKITGAADAACTIYGTTKAIGYAAKTVRVLQLARFAMIFLNVADQIKAGDAKPEDVSYLGKILTTPTKNERGEMNTATDSFGYRYAAYGDKGTLSTTASRYLAAGGLTGALINITSTVNGVLGGTPEKTCHILKNPFVGIGSLIIGVGALLVPGVNIALTPLQIAKAGGILALNIAAMFLPAMLKDIIAGVLVDENTVGEAAGDAITSGASGIMGSAAKAGGNAPLTPDQAVAYNDYSNKIAAKYAKWDQVAYSQFDATNSNTFMGRIVAQLIPYASKLSSLSSALSSLTSLTSRSLASLTPITYAMSADDYSTCQDSEYRSLNLATDPYCNVMYGMPPEALTADPIEVADNLIGQGQIDSETGDPIQGSDYEKFVNDCINRTRPLGDSGQSSQGDNGSKCLYNNSNKNYYIHYIDQRVQKGMDEEAETETESSGSSADPGDSSQPANTIKKGSGWGLKDNVDYSNVPCASGTTDKGIYTHPVQKFKIRRCSTQAGEVASIISQRTINLLNAAKKDGINLTGSGFRSYEEQQRLYTENCSRGVCHPPTAHPGNSQHERALAIDFEDVKKGGEIWNWLSSNGASYGFINWPVENWHWSMSGN